MKRLISEMSRFNVWYDGLQPIRRFTFFLVALMGWVPLVSSLNPVLMVIGSVWMTITCAIALTRI